MTVSRHGRQTGHQRILEMLAILQLGLCGRCGRACYASRRTARHAVRIAAPGTRLRAYQCGDTWHLTAPPGRPQFIAPPVTLPYVRSWNRLDLHGRGKRRYQNRRGPRGGSHTPRPSHRLGAGSPVGRR